MRAKLAPCTPVHYYEKGNWLLLLRDDKPTTRVYGRFHHTRNLSNDGLPHPLSHHAALRIHSHCPTCTLLSCTRIWSTKVPNSWSFLLFENILVKTVKNKTAKNLAEIRTACFAALQFSAEMFWKQTVLAANSHKTVKHCGRLVSNSNRWCVLVATWFWARAFVNCFIRQAKESAEQIFLKTCNITSPSTPQPSTALWLIPVSLFHHFSFGRPSFVDEFLSFSLLILFWRILVQFDSLNV
jgi:hypothetical protein